MPDEVIQPTAAPVAAAPDPVSAPPAPVDGQPGQPADNKAVELVSEKFAALAREQRRWEQERGVLKGDIDAAKQFQEIKARAKSNPREVYSMLGLTFDDLVQYELAGGTEPTPSMQIKALQDKLAEFETGIKTEKQQQIEQQQKQQVEAANYQAKQLYDGMVNYIKSEPDKYELVNLNGSYDLVWQEIVDTWQSTGGKTILTFAQAAEGMEKRIEEAYDKNAKARKFAARMEASAAQQAQVNDGKIKVTPINAPTLTQQNSVRTAPVTRGPRTDREIQRDMKEKMQALMDQSGVRQKQTITDAFTALQQKRSGQ